MNLINSVVQSASDMEARKIITELNDKQDIQFIPYKPDVTQFIIPAASSYKEIQVRLIDYGCEYKQLIFIALYTASYIACFTDDVALSNKAISRQYIPPFINYLNSIEISESNRVSILKDFETYRVKSDGLKTQSTGTISIIKLINISLNYNPFTSTLDSLKISYLSTLTKTKVAPSDDKSFRTLSVWFGFHSWLRRDDIGIGIEMFNRIASPKALTTSLRITSEVTLYQIQQAKYALIAFFDEHNITTKQLSLAKPSPSRKVLSTEDYECKIKEWKSYIYFFIKDRFAFLQKAYYSTPSPSSYLTLAFEMIIYSWCVDFSVNDAIRCFKVNQSVKYFLGKRTRFLVSKSPLFSHEFLYELAKSAHSDKSDVIPVSNIEHLLFQWLMAYQSVQLSDIYKLKLNNFRFVKRVNGRITHIESEYFKGRSNDTHHLKSIKADSDIGKAILNFIDDRTIKKENIDKVLTSNIGPLSTANKGTLSLLVRLCARSTVRGNIDDSFLKHKSSSVFIDALCTIIENGVAYKVYENNAKKHSKDKVIIDDWLMECDSPKKWEAFGISTIKTSSVHARSDNFNPTQLQNYNSHSNNTERDHYRNEDNQEWSNNCGRITRAVMQDICINVLSPSKSQIQSFNSDFTRTAESINMHCSDVINRLKLVTGKNNGHVNEIGFVTGMNIEQGDLPDTLYLLDSPETVMRFHHYIHEVKIKHKHLAIQAQDYLLYSVLPTVEWMSQLLAERRFTKENLIKGKVLFEQYATILPPNFSAQLGG